MVTRGRPVGGGLGVRGTDLGLPAFVKPARPAAPKPTVVLMHGGWADSSGWAGVITWLRDAGYPVIAASNPLRGLPIDTVAVKDVLCSVNGPIILVGHSYGGAVISN